MPMHKLGNELMYVTEVSSINLLPHLCMGTSGISLQYVIVDCLSAFFY